jgi:hypothetical protein
MSVPEPVQAAEKAVETAVKQPSKLNILAVVGVALVANLVGVIFRV